MNASDFARTLGAELLPSVDVSTAAGGRLTVPRFLRRERRVPIEIPRQSNCWAPNKPTLELDGHATWAELVLVELLVRDGWDARWMKNWVGGREPCRAVGGRLPMTDAAGAKLAAIDQRAAIGTSGGAWDIFAWKGDRYLIIESKQHKSSDKLRPGQIRWLGAAVVEGVTDFAIVEYDAGPPPARR